MTRVPSAVLFAACASLAVLPLMTSCTAQDPERAAVQELIENDPAWSDLRPVFAGENRTDPELRGTWATRGHGNRLVIGSRGVRLLCETESFVVDTMVGEELGRGAFDLYVRPGPELDTWSATDHPSTQGWVLERAEDERPARALDGEWTPLERFDLFAETMGENFAFFELWQIDWPARTAEQRARILPTTTDTELFDAFAAMLDGIEDAHTGLGAAIDGERHRTLSGKGPTKRRIRERFEEQTEVAELDDYYTSWVQAYIAGIRDDLLGGNYQEDPGRTLTWGLLPDGVGYLHIAGMGGFGEGPVVLRLAALAQTLDALVRDFEGAPGVVIDLTHNRGGEEPFGTAIAARFVAERRLAYTKVARGSGLQPYEVWAEPADAARYEGPVFVLTSDISVSAAETFALWMATQDHCTLAGTPTRGCFSDMLEKPLPGGFQLTLSNETYTTPDGRCPEGLGVLPDVPLQVFDPVDPARGHLEAVEQVRRLVLNAAH